MKSVVAALLLVLFAAATVYAVDSEIVAAGQVHADAAADAGADGAADWNHHHHHFHHHHVVMDGYIPLSSPSDTVDTVSLTAKVPSIAHIPECIPRPQTIAEIHRMRDSASRIAHAIEHEVVIMRRRKLFVEQMTAYLNDRIRELNKVKSELAEEVRWIQLSQHRIAELSEREKLVKLQDILQCINRGKTQLGENSKIRESTAKSLQDKATKLEAKVAKIKQKINDIEAGKPAGKEEEKKA